MYKIIPVFWVIIYTSAYTAEIAKEKRSSATLKAVATENLFIIQFDFSSVMYLLLQIQPACHKILCDKVKTRSYSCCKQRFCKHDHISGAEHKHIVKIH